MGYVYDLHSEKAWNALHLDAIGRFEMHKAFYWQHITSIVWCSCAYSLSKVNEASTLVI